MRARVPCNNRLAALFIRSKYLASKYRALSPFVEAGARLPGWTRACCTGRVWTAARVHESRRKKPWIRLACDPPLGSASRVPPRPAALASPGVKGRRGGDSSDEAVTSTTRTSSSSSVAVPVPVPVAVAN